MAVHVLSAMYYVGQFDGRFNQRAAPPVRGLGSRDQRERKREGKVLECVAMACVCSCLFFPLMYI